MTLVQMMCDNCELIDKCSDEGFDKTQCPLYLAEVKEEQHEIDRKRDRATILDTLQLNYKLDDLGDLMLNCLLEYIRKSPEHLEFIFDSTVLAASIDAFPYLLTEADDDELFEIANKWTDRANRRQILDDYKKTKRSDRW